MNPFGSSDDEEEDQRNQRAPVPGSEGRRMRREKIHYPGDLNPFGEEDEEEEDRESTTAVSSVGRGRGTEATGGEGKWKQVIGSGSSRNVKAIDVSIKDQSILTFGNNDSDISTSSKSNRYDDSLNPFGSDEDDDHDDDEYNDSSSLTTNSTNATTTEPSSLASAGSASTPVPRPRTSINHHHHHHQITNSQPVSRETTPISLRRSIGSNVSRSSLDSRARKTNSIIKPSVPPPPAPGSPAHASNAPDQSPLRPRRSPKQKPAPRPGNMTPGTKDKWLTVSDVIGIGSSDPDSESNEKNSDATSTPTNAESAENLQLQQQQDEAINPDPRLTGESAEAGESAIADPRILPVPAVRRISLTPSASEETAISLSPSEDLDQSNSCNHRNGRGDEDDDGPVRSRSKQTDLTGDSITGVQTVSLSVTESFPSPHSLSSSSSIPVEVKQAVKTESSPSPSCARRGMKKRPAPAPPQAIRRTVCGSLTSIQFDLNAIGDRLAIIQGQVKELEAAFRRDAVTAVSAVAASSTGSHKVKLDQKSMITQYLELARETCTLARKQEELMYQRTEHKLEQEHADLEFNIRKIDLIPEFKRTPEDEKKSKDMITRLVDVIDQRNDVVENMTKINKRPDFDKRVERLRKMCHDESELDSLLSAFLEANDMDVITTEMSSLTINNEANGSAAGANGMRPSGDHESGKKNKNKVKDKKKSKSATLRLPHFKSKDKLMTSGDTMSTSSSSSPSPNKGKSSTLKTIKKLGGGLKVKQQISPSNNNGNKN